MPSIEIKRPVLLAQGNLLIGGVIFTLILKLRLILTTQ